MGGPAGVGDGDLGDKRLLLVVGGFCDLLAETGDFADLLVEDHFAWFVTIDADACRRRVRDKTDQRSGIRSGQETDRPAES